MSGFAIRAVEPGDLEALVAARDGLPAPPDSFARCSRELWSWRVLANPDGYAARLAVDSEGRVLALVAAVRRRVRIGDESVSWLWPVDVFNASPAVPSLARHAALLATAKAFLEEEGGPAPDRAPVVWGLTTRAVFRLGFARFQAEAVRNQTKLRLVPKELRGEFDSGLTVEDAEGFPAAVDELFERARAPYGAIAVRDAATLNHRFARHPERPYRIALARNGETLVGYAVFRAARYDGCEDGLVCDWLVDPAAPAAGHELRRRLAEYAAQAGRERLTAVFPDTAPEWLAFQHAGFRVEHGADFLMARSFQRPWEPQWLHRHAYYTLGDFHRC